MTSSRRPELAVLMVALAVGLCLLAGALPIVNLSQRGPRVVAAVKASYPDVCSEWRDALVAQPAALGWYTTWEVRCRKGLRPATVSVLTVNVVTCQARAPLELSLSWRKLWAALFAVRQAMPVCP